MEPECTKDEPCTRCVQWDRQEREQHRWCRFMHGTTQCINGPECPNPYHVEDRDPWSTMNIKRDRFGRYLLPHPETGEEKAFTRVTTAAKTLEDTFNLNQWAKRQVAWGIGLRDDLRDLAASADGPDDKGTLDDVVRQAEAAAASSKKANVGTALHGITQKIDRGDANVRIPDIHRDRVTRYKTCVAQHRIEFLPEMIERIVVVPELGLAGQIDRVANWVHSGLPVVLDLKTGGSIDFSKVSIAQQLAAYANATHYYERGEMYPMPELNREVALVIHLPENDEPKVYSVNIVEGYSLLGQSMEVRAIRTGKGKHLFTEITADAVPTPAADREEALRARVRKIIAEGHAAAIKGLWRADVPTLKEGGLTPAHLDLVEGWVEQVEKDKEVSF